MINMIYFTVTARHIDPLEIKLPVALTGSAIFHAVDEHLDISLALRTFAIHGMAHRPFLYV